MNSKRAYYLEYRRHARIGSDVNNTSKPGVYVVYAEREQGYLLKVGADDPTNYNGHKPLPVGTTVNIDRKSACA